MKKSLINAKISFALTVVLIITIGYFLNFIPNKLDVDYIKEVYVRDISNWVAEKSELMQYIVLTVSFPILYIMFNVLFNKIKLKNEKMINDIFNILFIIILIILIIVTFIVPQTYLNRSVYYDNKIICFGALIISIILTIQYEKITNKKKINFLIYAILGIIIAICSCIYVDNCYAVNGYTVYHVNAYLYPVLKVISGLTIGIDFNCLYGNYSYFFAFILSIFNKSDIFSLSIIIAILVAISIGGLAIFINKVIENKIIAFMTVLSCICSLIIQPLLKEGIYLQYVPHRILFPILILIYIEFYLKMQKNKCKSLLQVIGFIISSISIFWNIETGIVVLGTWVLFLGYEVLFYKSIKDKTTYKEIGKIILMTIFSLLLYFIMLNIITIIRTGQLISIKNILFGQTLLLSTGYFMIRMPLWHPWLIIVMVYMIALAISLKNLKFIKKEENGNYEKNSLMFSIAILGMGIFSYYQGRSHNDVFLSVVYPAFVLMGIYLDFIIQKIKEYKGSNEIYEVYMSIIGFILIAILTLYSSSVIYYIFTNKSIHNSLSKKQINILEDRLEVVNDLKNIVGELNFALNEEFHYYSLLGIPDKRNFSGYVDLFTKEECKKIIGYLENTETTLYTDEWVYNILQTNFKNELDKLLEDRYTIIRNNKGAILFIDKNNWENIEEIQILLEKL